MYRYFDAARAHLQTDLVFRHEPQPLLAPDSLQDRVPHDVDLLRDEAAGLKEGRRALLEGRSVEGQGEVVVRLGADAAVMRDAGRVGRDHHRSDERAAKPSVPSDPKGAVEWIVELENVARPKGVLQLQECAFVGIG